jgi:hypothetical protein
MLPCEPVPTARKLSRPQHDRGFVMDKTLNDRIEELFRGVVFVLSAAEYA